jgi:hypothetical protein
VDKDKALHMALKAFEWNYNTDLDNIPACEKWAKMLKENITAIKEALAQPKPVQVSPLDFVTMTLEKEHLVGRPIIWAQWPNEEKNGG